VYYSFLQVIRELLGNALQTSFMLFKIIVPISILTRLLQQWGIVDYFGIILSPVMELVGLPGQIGLVWATAMITNLFDRYFTRSVGEIENKEVLQEQSH